MSQQTFDLHFNASNLPTEQLVNEILAGNTALFGVVWERYRIRIERLVSRFVSEPSDVEDLTQTTFLKAFRALPSFRGECQFYTWLYRIAKNTTLNHLKRQSSRGYSFDIEEDGSLFGETLAAVSSRNPETELDTHESIDIAHATLNRLPAEMSEALMLNVISGLSYADVARLTDCPVGTIRSRISRARSYLQSAMLQAQGSPIAA